MFKNVKLIWLYDELNIGCEKSEAQRWAIRFITCTTDWMVEPCSEVWENENGSNSMCGVEVEFS